MNSPGILAHILQHRIFVAWMFWASAMMSNATVGVLLELYMNDNAPRKSQVLQDIGFMILPFIRAKSFGFSIPDLCSITSASFLALFIVSKMKLSFSAIILRRILLIGGMAYFGRVLSIPMTLLPNPDPDCNPIILPQSWMLSILLVPFGSTVTCCDVFYSGHTIPISCAILTWIYYVGHRYPIISLLGVPFPYLDLSVSSQPISTILSTYSMPSW